VEIVLNTISVRFSTACETLYFRPIVKFGKVDPGLETENPILTPVNGTKDFTTAIVVTPQKPGRKTLCVQTQTSQGYIYYYAFRNLIPPSPSTC
jgi:hypothetical protein